MTTRNDIETPTAVHCAARAAGRRRGVARLVSQAGMSVVELVAGLTLVTVVAGTAVPAINRWYGQNELLRGADAVKMDVSRARMKAVSTNRHVRIRVLGTKTAYVMETSSDGTSWTSPSTIALPSGVRIDNTGSIVQFDRRGFASRMDSITIANVQNKTLTVATTSTGRVRVQ